MVAFFIHDDGEDFQLASRDHWVRKCNMIPGFISTDQDGSVWENQEGAWAM